MCSLWSGGCKANQKDMNDFDAFNKVTIEFLGDHHPARATVKVLALPLEAPCGLEVIAATN